MRLLIDFTIIIIKREQKCVGMRIVEKKLPEGIFFKYLHFTGDSLYNVDNCKPLKMDK